MAVQVDALPATTTVTSDDLLMVVNDPGGTPNTFVITVGNFLANVTSITTNELVLANSATPANSGITVSGGVFWFDATYLYIATANNTVKRVTLEAF